MTELNESQKRYKILFEKHVDIKSGVIFDKEFEKDIIQLRSMGKEMLKDDLTPNHTDRKSPFVRFVLKYKFPISMIDFLYSYVLDGSVEFKEITSGMYLVSDVDKTAIGRGSTPEGVYLTYDQIRSAGGHQKPSDELKLILSASTSLKQAKNFLTDNWDFIKSKQPLYRINEEPIGTIRPYFNAKRDHRVLELLETHSIDEVTIMISKDYPTYHPTYMEIAKIKSRLRLKDSNFDT